MLTNPEAYQAEIKRLTEINGQLAAALDMQIFAKRTKMASGKERRGLDYAYDVYVTLESLPAWLRDNPHKYTTVNTTGPGGKRIDCVDYAVASQSRVRFEMPQGFEKYGAWLEHEKAARRYMWNIVRRTFKETKALGLDTMPILWATYQKPRRLNSDCRWYRA
tara:strand:+ start:115 stop:603 length:489 start_codon:yes stop_codon:yes gene_type:complete